MTILRLLTRTFLLNFTHFWIALISINTIYSQSKPAYEMKLTNGVKISDSIIEFDILLKGVNTSFILTSYQCSFLFNSEIKNDGVLSFSYVAASSQLNNYPSFGIGINIYDGEPKLTFASMAGSDTVFDSDVIVGRFRLVNTTPFANVDPNISWNFGGFVSTILTGEAFRDITEPNNHTTNLTLASRLVNSEIPENYQLFQNYPNPFNPSTTIRIELKNESFVKLVVYNLLGEAVQELANNKIAAGNHEFTFYSNDLPSGSYFYRLEANNELIGTKKMLVLK